MKKRLPVFVVLVGVAAVLTVLYLRSRLEEDAAWVLVSGNIELTQIDIGFKVPGKLISLEVEEGDFVEQGTLLAQLDPDQLLRTRESISAQIAAGHSRRSELQKLILFQRRSMDAQLVQRRAEVRQAEAFLEELETGSRSQEIQEARAALQRAQAILGRALRDFERAGELFQNEDISAAQYDQAKFAFSEALAAQDQAAQRLLLVEEGPRRERIESARASLERAQGALQQVEAMELEIERSRQSLQTLDSEIAALEAESAVVQSQLDDLTVRSPITGVVLTRSAEVGEVIGAGTTILSIGDLSRPWVRGYIPETQLGRVKLGAAAEVTTDSFPDRVYRGKLSFISSEAEFTPKQIQTREERVRLVYRLKVDLENPNQELKLNMPVDARIRQSG